MRKTLMLIMAIAMVITAIFVLSACGETPETTNGQKETTEAPVTTDKPADEKVTYTVIVKDQDGNGVEGVEVQICEGEVCRKPRLTDLEGRVTFSFVPNGEQLKVQINGDNSVSGFKYPEGYTILEDGKTTIEFTVEAQSTYTVTASDLFGGKCADIAVELYTAKNELVERKVTDVSGKVKFVVDRGEYYVKITHVNNNPAYVFTNPDAEGGNTRVFEKDQYTFDASIIVLNEDIPYTVTVKDVAGKPVADASVTLYNKANSAVAVAYTDENGVVTLYAPNGNYFAVAYTATASTVVSFVKNGVAAGEIALKADAAGASKDTAAYAGSEFFVKDGENVWYFVADGYKKVLTVASGSAKVVYNGKTYTAENGKVSVSLTEKDGEAAYFQITGAGAAASVSMPGSASLPFALDASTLNGKKISLSLGAGEETYYTFVASKDGTVAVSSSAPLTLLVNDRENRYVVKKGDSVTVMISSATAQEAEVTFSYTETKADYKVVMRIDGETAAGVKVTMYKLVDGRYVQIAEGVTAEDGSCVFADLTECRDYYYSVSYPDYELYEEYVSVEDILTELVLTHVADGTVSYPFGVETDSNGDPITTEGSVTAGNSVWYSMFIPSNYKLTVSNADVTVKIYLDTNGDFFPSPEDTPVVPEWDADANAYVYSFTLSGVDRERCLIEVTAAKDADFALSFTENPAEE